MPRKSDAFWHFSLHIYSRTGVERACLALQDAGADVNLILYCCWQGGRAKILSKDSMKKAIRLVATWQQRVVQPLRQARRISKQPFPGVPPKQSSLLHKHIAKAELNAEHLEQIALAQLPIATARGIVEMNTKKITEENLECYMELLGIPVAAPIEKALNVLMGSMDH
ncbi:MAG: TIGR02444 family protein [Proteobacteria bacterium]|nr:TIGR02444 family protein [Pseudomonadota bacterium]